MGRARYFLTALEDYTQMSEVVLLKQKSDAASALKAVIKRWEVQQHARVQRIRSDRGGEYTGGEMKAWAEEKGIAWDPTAPYSPQQNGAAERLNRTLLEKVRAMLREAQMADMWWGEALKTANYIRVRLPTNSLPNSITPFQLWYGRKPDLKHMRTFGCKAFVLLPKPKQPSSKVQPTSIEGKLVGYESGSKVVYRIARGDSKQVYLSTDVKFMEETAGESFGGKKVRFGTVSVLGSNAAPIAVEQSDSKEAGGVSAAAPNVAPVPRAEQAEEAEEAEHSTEEVEPAVERAQGEQDEEEAQRSAAQSDDEGDSAQRSNGQSSSQAGDESSSDDEEEAPPAPRRSARLAQPPAAPAPAARAPRPGAPAAATPRAQAPARAPSSGAPAAAPSSGELRASARAKQPSVMLRDHAAPVSKGSWQPYAAAAAPEPAEPPQTYEQAFSSPQAEFWKQAMDEEMSSLAEHGTWTLERTPSGVVPVGTRWIFAVKNQQGGVPRYKARLVAQG